MIAGKVVNRHFFNHQVENVGQNFGVFWWPFLEIEQPDIDNIAIENQHFGFNSFEILIQSACPACMRTKMQIRDNKYVNFSHHKNKNSECMYQLHDFPCIFL